MKILFSDEKYFDIDDVYNFQNDRVWAVNRPDADEKAAVEQKRKHSEQVMVWLGACSMGITLLVIFNEGTVDHAVYIKIVRCRKCKKVADDRFERIIHRWIEQMQEITNIFFLDFEHQVLTKKILKIQMISEKMIIRHFVRKFKISLI